MSNRDDKIETENTVDDKRRSDSMATTTESKDWFSSEPGRDRVLQLLRNAGVPLELRVASQCKDFCRRHDGEDGIRITTIRAIYAERRSDKAPREVDQSVQFDKEIDLTERTSVRLRLRVPIECKCREGIEVFGFPRPKGERVASLPMLSDFAGATLLNQLAYTEPSNIRDGRESSITLIHTDKGKNRIYEEQLLYKSGSALYDFIRTVETDGIRLRVDDIIREFGLLDRLREYCKPSGDWFSVFRRFIRELPEQVIKDFNEKWLERESPDGMYSLEASLHVPVICIDARMFTVPCTRRGKLSRLLPCNSMMTGLRIDNWQWKMSYFLGKRTPEVLAMVCQPKGLNNVLDSCLAWYKEMAMQLEHSDTRIIRRALLEGLLYKSTGATNRKRRRRVQPTQAAADM